MDHIHLEITESGMYGQRSRQDRTLHRFSEKGVGVGTLDDFGTGFSTIANILELPGRLIVKIDKGSGMVICNRKEPVS